MATLKNCGSTDLDIGPDRAWDGAAAAARVWEWAGFDGDSPDVAKAKRVFLIYDSDAPELKGSYHLLIADVIDGTPKAIPNGVRNAKSRAPQVKGASAEVVAAAQATCDAYLKRINGEASADPVYDAHKRLLDKVFGRDPKSVAAEEAERRVTAALQPSLVHEVEVSGRHRHVSFGGRELELLAAEPGMTGYLARKYVVTDRGTYFTTGAFTKTIAEHPARPHLWQHWPDLIIGVNKEPVEDRKGLKIKAVLNEGDQLGARAMEVYRFGAQHGWVPDWSIGFDPIKDRAGKDEEYDRLDFAGAGQYAEAKAGDLRAITEASWWEGSTVTWGAIHNAGPDTINLLSTAADITALAVAAREGRLTNDQLSQIDDLIAARQTRAGAGDRHSTPPAPSQDQFAASLDLLMVELGVTEQAAA